MGSGACLYSGAPSWLQMDADNYDEDGSLTKFKDERGYNYEDSVHMYPDMPDYETTVSDNTAQRVKLSPVRSASNCEYYFFNIARASVMMGHEWNVCCFSGYPVSITAADVFAA